ncbi:MAG: AI-2E family transporter [Methanothrix sp.]|nr:AI-2E family transporter [Methanothrix sp.]
MRKEHHPTHDQPHVGSTTHDVMDPEAKNFDPGTPTTETRHKSESLSSGQPGLAPGNTPASNRWSEPTRYIMAVILFLAGLLVVYIGRSAIPLVVSAALLALLVDPIIQFLSGRLRINKNLAVVITYMSVVALLLIVPLLLVQPLVDAVNFAVQIDPNLIVQRAIQFIQSVLTQLQGHKWLASVFDPALNTLLTALNNFSSTSETTVPAMQMSVADLSSRLGRALGAVAGFLGPTFSGMASVLFTLLMALQMTLSAGEFKNWFSDLIPPGHGPELSLLLKGIHKTWTGFLRGQIHLMLIVGLVTWLGGFILGLPQAFFLGVIAGFMELIPNVGPILAAVPAVLVALLFGSTHLAVSHLVFALVIIGFYTLVQMLENQFLVPKVMGGAVDLPPLIVLIGVIAGSGAFGIMGALLATPAIATGKLIFRYIYGKIMDGALALPPSK